MSFFYPLMALILLLSGCVAPILERESSYIPPSKPGGRMCTFQCNKALGRCLQGCSLKKRACFVGMQTQALKDYEKYMQEQFKARHAMNLRISDFERPERCEQSFCRGDCEKAYNVCYTKCGGSIEGNPRPPQPSF